MQGFTGQVFTDGDLIRLRQTTRTANNSLTIADAWGTVVYVSRDTSTMPTTQTYTFTRSSGGLAGTASGTISAGTLALDYGTTGNGYIETTAVDGTYSPYQQIVTWTTHPLTTTTTKTRMGKLTGISDADFGGALTGFGFYVEQGYFKGNIVVKSGVSQALSAASIQIGNITGAAASGIKISNTGTASTSGIFGYTSGSAESFALKLDGTANIAGWSFSATQLYTANVLINSGGYISFGGTPPTSYGNNVGVWIGYSTYGKVSIYADASNYFQWDGTKLLIKAANFTLDSSGNLTASSATVSGAITASSGSIGSFTIGTYLYTGSKTAWNDTNAGVHLGSDGIGIGNNVFTVNGSTGALVATSATITGAVTATSGSIGSFTIGTYLYTGSKTAWNDSNAGVHLGSDGIGIGNNVFTVNGSTGAMVATSATITGAVTATSGSIGSFTIGTYLYTGSKTAWNDANAGVHIGSDGIGIGNNVFTVNGSTGALVATSATITGTISSSTITASTLSTATTGPRVLIGSGDGKAYINFISATGDAGYISGLGGPLQVISDAQLVLGGSSIVFNDGSDHTVWHAGNDVAGSGLDADLLDGSHASAFALSGHNHSGTYLPVSGAGDIYTHNASEFATAGHNHSGVYSPLAGSSSIVTVGTITSGTWNGSSISTSYTAAKYVGTYHSRADAPSPTEGDVWHDSDDDTLYIYAGGGWRQVAIW